MKSITVERKPEGSCIAFLDGDRTRWDNGRTAEEAIGKLVISYSRDLEIDLDLSRALRSSVKKE